LYQRKAKAINIAKNAKISNNSVKLFFQTSLIGKKIVGRNRKDTNKRNFFKNVGLKCAIAAAIIENDRQL